VRTDPPVGADCEPTAPGAASRGATLDATLVDALFAQAPYSVALYDVQGRVAAANAAYERHFGIRLADLPPDFSLLSDPQLRESGLLDQIRRAYDGVVVMLPPIRYDAARATGGAGQAVWTQGHCYPVRDAAGAVAYIAVVHTDVTERVEAESALRAANAELNSQAALLQDQGLELELSNQALHERAAELESATEELAQARDAAMEARASAEALRGRAEASEALARQLFALSPLPKWVYDAETLAFLEVNEAAVRRYGYTREEFLGMTIRDIRPPEDIPLMLAVAQAPHPTGQLGGIFHHRTKAGEILDVEVFLRDVQYEGRRGVIAVVHDITERRRAEAALQEAIQAAEAARDDAEAANRTKGEFLATMSHELRTPLNAIAGYVDLLDLGIRGPVTPEQRADLARIQASSRHLLGLINDILDLSRIDAGELAVAREDAETATAIRAALDLTRVQADARGVVLVDARSEAGTPYVGDEQRVRQILVNLLANAIKFTPPGERVAVTDGIAAEAPAAVRVYGRGPWAYVRVEDTGVGIAPDAQGRIFEPFVQIDQTRTRPVGGSGLGLAISRRLARLMGGDLTVESTPGVGSTFALWLPAPAVLTNLPGTQSESASDRGARAERYAPTLAAPGVDQIGEALRESVDDLLGAYADRLRADPALPWTKEMRRTQLEDHAVSFLADLAQSLVIVADAGGEAAALLRDGSAIQRTIAEAHGARRHAQGWTEEAVRRDHAVLREELERAVRSRIGQGQGGNSAAGTTPQVEEAVALLLRLADRAETISIGGWRAAARAADVTSSAP
jgi:PAS domain S-box-containing protein